MSTWGDQELEEEVDYETPVDENGTCALRMTLLFITSPLRVVCEYVASSFGFGCIVLQC